MRARILLLAVAFAGVGCAGDGSPGLFDAGAGLADVGVEDAGALDAGPADAGRADAGGVDAAAPDAAPPIASWSSVQSILQERCRGCHGPNNPTRRTVVTVYDNLVNVQSGRFTLVVPGDPQASFLYAKVTGETARYCSEQGGRLGECGGVMPPRPNPMLTEPQIDAMRGWIEDGAPEN